MLSLVYENASIFTLPADPLASTTASTMVFRPRLEGYESALRGAALSAKFADEALVSFQIRPTSFANLTNVQAYLSIQPFQVLGVDVADDGTTSFPVLERDVSGVLTLFQGKLAFDMSVTGVAKASLRLVNLGAVQTVLVYTQIYGRIRPEEWEGERLGYKEA